VRVAVIGTGRIGQLHGALMASQPGVNVVVHDIDAERARSLADAIGGEVASTPEEALERAEATIIAASTNAHAQLVRKSVDRGLPTFCEKPLALALDETIDVVEHVERAGVPVQIGLQRRFDPAYVEARRRRESGELGTIYLVRMIASDHEPPPDAYIPVSGGLFRDSSIHDFDSIRWMTGLEVTEVYAAGSVRGFPIFARHDDVDTGAVVLRLSDGTLGVLGQTRHNPLGYDVRMEIVGSLDTVALGVTTQSPIHLLDEDAPPIPGPGWSSFLDRFEAAYRAELLAFLRVARGEISSPCTARDALEAMRISVAADRSRAAHRPIRMDEIEGGLSAT
jgi:myo-inositol 2-dehydrogenase/D-chiro-inositol 1-dehydrogenase